MTLPSTRSNLSAAAASKKRKHLAIVSALVNDTESWAKEFDWSTRRLEKTIVDSDMGDYDAPGLIMQKEFTRVLLDPLGRIDDGPDAVANLYMMPEYDDIARLLSKNGEWKLGFFSSSNSRNSSLKAARRQKWTKKLFATVLKEITRHAT